MLTALVAEIREIKQTLQKEDGILLALAAGKKRPLLPHLKFEYPDSHIHEDLYKLIKYSCEEVCTTKEQLNKVIKVWTSFMEPMLGVILRTHGVDTVEDVKARNEAARNGVGAAAERRRSPGADPATVNPGPPKLAFNGGGNSLADIPKHLISDVDTTTRDVSSCDSDAICREGSSTNAQPKTQNDVIAADRISEQLVRSSSSPQSGVQVGQEPKSNNEAIPSSLGVSAIRLFHLNTENQLNVLNSYHMF